MKTSPQGSAQQLQSLAQENPLVYLLAARMPSTPAKWIRITNNTEDIPYGVDVKTGLPNIYTHHPMDVGEIERTMRGELHDLTIKVEGLSQATLRLIYQNEWLVDQPFVLTWVQAAPPYLPAARLPWEGVILNTRLENGGAVFTIGNAIPPNSPFPGRSYSELECGVDEFGDPRCGYVIPAGATNVVGGGFNRCGMNHFDCVQRGLDELARGLLQNHPRLFFAFPGLLTADTL